MNGRGTAPTLIVFIATIVLAVSLVGVFAVRAGDAHDRSRSTGNAALSHVRSGVFLFDVAGESNASGVSGIRALARLAGSDPLSLSSLMIFFETMNTTTQYRYSGSDVSSVDVAGTNGTFGVEYVQLRGSGNPFLGPGDIIAITFPTPRVIGAREDVRAVFTTAAGVTTRIEVRTPGVFPKSLVHLYP